MWPPLSALILTLAVPFNHLSPEPILSALSSPLSWVAQSLSWVPHLDHPSVGSFPSSLSPSLPFPQRTDIAKMLLKICLNVFAS